MGGKLDSHSRELLLGTCLLARPAAAQVTTQMLIGDAVSDVGNRYPDVDKAIQRFTNRDFLGARLLLDDAKRKDATLPPTDLTMAKLYFLSGDEAAARNALEATVSASPDDPEVFLILAKNAMQQGRTIEAQALYDKALELTEKFSENPKRKRNFEINVAKRSGGRRRAPQQLGRSPLPTCDALLKTDPENAMSHYRLGAAMFMQAKIAARIQSRLRRIQGSQEVRQGQEHPESVCIGRLVVRPARQERRGTDGVRTSGTPKTRPTRAQSRATRSG